MFVERWLVSLVALVVFSAVGLVPTEAAITQFEDLNIIADPGNPSDGLAFLDMTFSQGKTLSEALSAAQVKYPDARVATPSEFNDLFRAGGIIYDAELTAADGFTAGPASRISSGTNYNTVLRDALGATGTTNSMPATFILTDPDGSTDESSTRDVINLWEYSCLLYQAPYMPPQSSWGWLLVSESAGNETPFADAGPDQTVECMGELTEVSLDGTGSSDPDGDALGYEWSLPEGSTASIDDPASPTPTGSFPLGPTLVTLVVTDGAGGFDVDDVLITVVDTVPPVLVATTDKIVLWPPNHQMHDVLMRVEITDCAWDTGTAITAWVSSSEPDDGAGDGSYTGDVDGQDGFAAPVPVDLVFTGEPEPGVYLYEGMVSLRAERDGSESSRVYSIVCDIEDLGGNMSTASCVVVVPHDRRKK